MRYTEGGGAAATPRLREATAAMTVARQREQTIPSLDDRWRALLCQRAFVGGSWVVADDDARTAVLNPATGDALGSVPNLDAGHMGGAIAAAQSAFPAWRQRLPRQRADMLMAWRKLILDNVNALA